MGQGVELVANGVVKVRIKEVDRWMAGGRRLRNAATISVDVEGGCHAFGVKVASCLKNLSCTNTEVALPRTTSDKRVKAATGRQDSAQACLQAREARRRPGCRVTGAFTENGVGATCCRVCRVEVCTR